ncbi:hypothetical protein MMC28_010588 [Mycoblastus sanguinarius]|nr:hypothetical protein [Mycoblastus sanguinarius]
MPVVDLDSVQFYRPPIKACQPCKRVPKASNANGPSVVGRGKSPKASGPSDGWRSLWGDDPIKFIDMTDSPFTERLSPIREPAPDLKDTEADTGDNPNGLCNTGDLDHGISEDNYDLPTLEELLLVAEEIRKSEGAGLRGEH